MKKVPVTLVSVLMATLGLATPRLASACGPLSVEADPRVVARWPDLVDRVRSAFEDRTDIDTCARVRLALRARFHVEVALPDGRVAERAVPQVDDVVPILEALLVVPTAEPLASEPSVASPSAAEPAVATTTPPPRRAPPIVPNAEVVPAADLAAPVEGKRPRSTGGFRPELSALVGARTGGGPLGLELGLLTFADVSSWLVGLGGRADHYASAAMSRTDLVVSALGGRRLRWGESVALDLVAGPALRVSASGVSDVEMVEVVSSRPREPPRPRPQEDETSTSARFAAGARLHFGMRSSLRTFVGIDGDVGPSAGPSYGRAPVATLGLAIGATVGAR